jgi:hypothetical protein
VVHRPPGAAAQSQPGIKLTDSLPLRLMGESIPHQPITKEHPKLEMKENIK